MMTETEVSEVATTEEKCELGMSQDPIKPDCNGISYHNEDNDHQKSCVYVTEVEYGLKDDIVDEYVVGGLSVASESNTIVDDQDLNDDVIDENVVGGLSVASESNTTADDQDVTEVDVIDENVAGGSSVASESNARVDDQDAENWDDKFPPLVSRRTIENGDRLQVSPANSLEEQDGKANRWVDVLKKPRKEMMNPRFRSFSATSTREIPRTEEPNSNFDVKNSVASNILLKTGDDGQMSKKIGTHENQEVTADKGTTEPVSGNGLGMVSRGNLTAEVSADDESTEKAKEKRRKEAEAEYLREQRWVEESAKAEAEYLREQRRLEELKAQKEAEKREKMREKRLRKKERRKAASRDVHDSNNNGGIAASFDSSKEIISEDIEVNDVSSATQERPQKPRPSTNRSKEKTVPLPRHCVVNKNIDRFWMLVVLIVLAIFAVKFSNVTRSLQL